ncbi:MAG: glycine C-acetyltransferase [Planctomycetota bacterium]|jgi:glycine C-acetyltransferase|nr:glycine C-acetyltransferase [Planctomycetota bacterium]
MTNTVKPILDEEIANIREAGLYKDERVILGPQGSSIRVGSDEVLNFCANNYLGLSSHPAIIQAAHDALDSHGYGMSSVRFICGTQDIHKTLEETIARFLGTEDTILYSSCFDANAGLFETILTKEDAIISDALNHASIIDGVRLCKAERHRYAHSDMTELEEILKKTQERRVRMIATDGVFSMDGDLAKLGEICDLAEKYNALVMVDDSHATGFIGKTGRGTPEHFGVQDRVDIVTSTLGKALGGASGGFTSGRREIIEFLRQRSRPYLFSNTVPPPIVGAAQKAFEILGETTDLRDKLESNTAWFRDEIQKAGFTIQPGETPIVPIMLLDAKLAGEFAKAMLAEGIYVIGFSYPVVPKGKARIRVQISAAHERSDIERALVAFIKVGKSLEVIS